MNNSILLLILFSILSFQINLSNTASFSLSNKDLRINKSPVVMRDFVTNYNSGSRDSLEKFISKYYHPNLVERFGGMEAAIDNWTELYATYGPLDYKYKEEDFFWLRGSISKAWVGLKLDLKQSDDTLQILNVGIRKGVVPSDAPAIPELSNENLRDTLKSYFNGMGNADLFSGSVIVTKDEELLFEGGYGYADKQSKQEITVNTPLNIASTGKMFTGVAIAQLVEKGKVSFSDPINKFIPEYPDHIADKVTVHNLLTHTSGIELDNITAFNEATKSARSVEELLGAQLKFLDQMDGYSNFELPEKFDYSNEGINLLGVIIERVSGQEYKEYLQENIFKPSEMTNSGIAYNTSSTPIAIGYTFEGSPNYKERLPNTSYLPVQAYPAGAHFSSAKDLYHFFKALLNYKLVNRSLVNKLTSMQIVEAKLPSTTYGYGYAFEVFKRDGAKMFGHAGGMPGVSTKVELYPEHEVWIIVLSNYDTAGTVAATYLRELLLP